MSLHTQMMRGLLALPVAALLILVGAIASMEAPAVDTTATAVAMTARAEASAVRTVDFHSMLPGALHVLRKVEVPIGKG